MLKEICLNQSVINKEMELDRRRNMCHCGSRFSCSWRNWWQLFTKN